MYRYPRVAVVLINQNGRVGRQCRPGKQLARSGSGAGAAADGSLLLGVLPRTRDWKAVVQLLREGAAVDEIAAASARAAESSLPDLARDETLVRSLWLLTQIPRAARSADFVGALQHLDLHTSRDPGLIDIVSAVIESVDRHVARAGRRTDFGEIAHRAAAESLATLAGRELPGLFGADAEDVRRAVGKFATVRNFGVLARDFFARLTRRHLEYYLGRELANHIGPGDASARWAAKGVRFRARAPLH